MPMNNFLQALDQLHSCTAEQCCIIFDAWSLEYVSLQPASMSNRISVPIPAALQNKFLGSTHILRDSVSTFHSDSNSLHIDFKFAAVSSFAEHINPLGSEKHVIYPYSIAQLVSTLERKTAWKLQLLQPYSEIQSGFLSINVLVN